MAIPPWRCPRPRRRVAPTLLRGDLSARRALQSPVASGAVDHDAGRIRRLPPGPRRRRRLFPPMREPASPVGEVRAVPRARSQGQSLLSGQDRRVSRNRPLPSAAGFPGSRSRARRPLSARPHVAGRRRESEDSGVAVDHRATGGVKASIGAGRGRQQRIVRPSRRLRAFTPSGIVCPSAWRSAVAVSRRAQGGLACLTSRRRPAT